MDLELTDAEKEQASGPTRAMEKASIYTNDYYSWAKEKAEQATVAATKDMFNAVAILMKEHQISEADALDMVREKTLECEKEHWAAVADLEAAGPISSNLYRYLDMTRFGHTGGMFWSAFTDRYNKVDRTQADRALKTRETLSMPSDGNTSAQQGTPPAPPNDSSSQLEHDPHTNGLHYHVSSSKGEPNPPTNGVVHSRDSQPAISEADDRDRDRSCFSNGLRQSHEPVGAYGKPRTDVCVPMMPPPLV